MSSKRYFPILKTTISEMRALKQVNCTEDSCIHPIFELTKARKSKKDEIGDVFKRIQEIKEIVGSNYFILDLTSEESLTNEQIDSYFDDYNAFENWRDFISSLISSDMKVCPVVQAYDDNTVDELEEQMKGLYELCNHFAIRIKPSYFDLDISRKLLQAAKSFKFTTILDLEYVDKENLEQRIKEVSNFIDDCISEDLPFQSIILCCSSFPAIVNHNNKLHGSFETYEKQLFSDVSHKYKQLDFLYGDYGSVHPFRNDITAYNWVPRIDFPLNSSIIYHRKQRDLGGYKNCAENISKSSEFKASPIPCWGYDEIIAAKVKPNGKSPSYWISVRINIHIHRVIDWLEKLHDITP